MIKCIESKACNNGLKSASEGMSQRDIRQSWTHAQCQLCDTFLAFVNTYIPKSPLSYHPPTHRNDADAKERYCEPLGQCLPCLSVIYPRRELGHPALRSTARWKGLASPSAHLAPLGRKTSQQGLEQAGILSLALQTLPRPLKGLLLRVFS